MKTKLFTFLVLFCSLVSLSFLDAQNPEWINYTNGKTIQALVIEGDNVWIGTTGGLVKLNKTTGEKTFYIKANVMKMIKLK
jgi:ligand-binding sensor domain-containing protein